MRISIVVPCLNVAQTIGRCLDSIDGQTYADVEVVIADGASCDATVDVISERSRTIRHALVWFSEPDRGASDAANKAVARVSGDWVLFLGADDKLAGPDVLSKVAPYLASAAPTHRIVYGRVAMVDNDGRILGYADRPWSPAEFRSCQFCIPTLATFMHRSMFEQYGSFDEDLKIANDYDFMLRELMHAEPVYIPDFTVTHMQKGGISTSRRTAPLMWKELIRLYGRHVGGTPWHLYWELCKSWVALLLYRLGGDQLVIPVTNLYRRVSGGRPPVEF
jgi:glycosyltransferase involved in cell wall biosynthesis